MQKPEYFSSVGEKYTAIHLPNPISKLYGIGDGSWEHDDVDMFWEHD